jgi:SAM-dependent methyltransferase
MILNNLLDIRPKDTLDDFFSRIKRHRKTILSIEQLKELSLELVAFYSGNKNFQYVKKNPLENHWYASLDKGKPDYSVYDNEIYISDVWACWVVYSRKYLRDIKKPQNGIMQNHKQIKKIIDIGCGFGYTTLALKQIFSYAEVIGTNLENTTQIKVGREIGSEYGFRIESDYDKLGKDTDLIFASEYFEHFEEPIEHLLEVIDKTNAKAFLFANAFGTKSIGHFHKYIINGEKVEGKKVSRIFHAKLKSLGYKRMETKIWNNRPDYWKRQT